MDKKYFRAASLILTVILLVVQINTWATSYFVSSSVGNDSNDGLSPVANSPHGPWKTISKVHSLRFNGGDSVLFKRGDSWNERLIVYSSGSGIAPLTYGAYGTGDRPVILCADKVTNWTLFDQNKNIWVAQINTSISSVSQVFVNGIRQTLSRWPNSGWNTIDATASEGYSLFDVSLTQSNNYWTGATLVIRSCMWAIEARAISASSGGSQTLKWDAALSYGVYATHGYGYYIENKFEELDFPGEYYFNVTTHSLYLALEKGKTPDKQTIEVAVRENGIYINERSYIIVSNLKVEKAATNGLLCYNSNNIKVQDCSIANSKKDGISFYCSPGSDLCLKGNRISNVDEGHGISVINMSGTEIINNEISDIASDTISPRQGGGIYLKGTDNSIVDNNTIDRVGGHGIHIANGPVNVSNNHLSECVIMVQDNGAIYLNGDHSRSLIEYNRIDDCPGNYDGTPTSQGPGSTVGLYSDETAFGAVFRYNIIVGCSYGIHLHKSYNTSVFNNIFYNNRVASISLQERAKNQMYGNCVKNNLCYVLNSSAHTLILSRFSTSDRSIGTFDNNLYYNPGAVNAIAYVKDKSYCFNLSDWQSKTETDSGNDLHSLSVNPLWVDATNGNFHLQSSSPCIDSGVSVGYSVDYDDTNVPQGKMPDIGAFEYSGTTGINPKEMKQPRLINFPNPFHQKTTIQFDVEHSGNVTLTVFDINGKIVKTLLCCALSPGKYSQIWDASDLNQGIYFIRMNAQKTSSVIKTYRVN